MLINPEIGIKSHIFSWWISHLKLLYMNEIGSQALPIVQIFILCLTSPLTFSSLQSHLEMGHSWTLQSLTLHMSGCHQVKYTEQHLLQGPGALSLCKSTVTTLYFSVYRYFLRNGCLLIHKESVNYQISWLLIPKSYWSEYLIYIYCSQKNFTLSKECSMYFYTFQEKENIAFLLKKKSRTQPHEILPANINLTQTDAFVKAKMLSVSSLQQYHFKDFNSLYSVNGLLLFIPQVIVALILQS